MSVPILTDLSFFHPCNVVQVDVFHLGFSSMIVNISVFINVNVFINVFTVISVFLSVMCGDLKPLHH